MTDATGPETAALENMIGALALAVVDRQTRAIGAATGLSPTAAAAVLGLGVSPGATIAELAEVAGVTHSVMVRQVADLAADGLVARAEGEDRRKVHLSLTPAGEALRRSILAARGRALATVAAAVEAADRPALLALVGGLLAAMTPSRAEADHLCRLCDEEACGDDCPVEARARAIEAAAP